MWSRVPETTLPLETTLRSVYMELWVVTAIPSSTLVSLETARKVTYWTKWWAPETIWVISPRVGEPKCLYEKNLSRLTGLPLPAETRQRLFLCLCLCLCLSHKWKTGLKRLSSQLVTFAHLFGLQFEVFGVWFWRYRTLNRKKILLGLKSSLHYWKF